jgi:hypothetical protein
VPLKADRDKSDEVDFLLEKLGNKAKTIPYYAIYIPGQAEPIHFGDQVITSNIVISKITNSGAVDVDDINLKNSEKTARAEK